MTKIDHNFAPMPNDLFELGLSDGALVTYATIRLGAFHVGSEHRYGQQDLAEKRGISVRQIRRHLDELIEVGAIEVRYGRPRSPMIITVLHPNHYDFTVMSRAGSSTHRDSDRTSVSGQSLPDRTRDRTHERTSMAFGLDTDVRSQEKKTLEEDQKDQEEVLDEERVSASTTASNTLMSSSADDVPWMSDHEWRVLRGLDGRLEQLWFEDDVLSTDAGQYIERLLTETAQAMGEWRLPWLLNALDHMAREYPTLSAAKPHIQLLHQQWAETENGMVTAHG